jgi:non-ribosomal peptide synthetase-like protein
MKQAPAPQLRRRAALDVSLDDGGTIRPASRTTDAAGFVLTGAGYDEAIRWHAGERLEHLFEERVDRLREEGRESHLAVGALSITLSYAELEARANQLARFLALRQGVRPGDRVGLLFDRAVDGYIGMLAVLKLHASYVPLDPAFPPERVSYIAADAGIRTLLSRSSLSGLSAALEDSVCVLHLDEAKDQIAGESTARLGGEEIADPVDDLCYIIYTSGTTGRPKGVAISHASICNFVLVAAEVYGLAAEDRVYQGLTIAFDFSVEEIWVSWMVGATLVPKPSGATLLGAELDTFLRDHRVTALLCVPTLLATLEEDLPDLRFLLVSGEPCPQDLVTRWHRSGRRFLNVYGPTEATVTATWTVLHPDRPVTIGVPLPTYSVVVLDPELERALPRGDLGEIAIAGIGLADGYVNRPDLTERSFIPDFLGIADNPSGRIYRTGDLGRINEAGEIEHQGRIDTQVKIRGYRIELTEIESVLRQLTGVGQAVVGTWRPDGDTLELVGYYSPQWGERAPDQAAVYGQLRQRLPAYMIPAYLEQIETVPLTAAGKIDRNALPAPVGPRGVLSHNDYIAPSTTTELLLADQLARVLGVERVSVDSHFFDELGADSLLMARFNAAIRGSAAALPAVSMKDVYLHPTVGRLAAAITQSASDEAPAELAADSSALPAPQGKVRYVLCGALQLMTFLGYVCLAALALDAGARWLADGRGLLELYARAVVLGGGLLLGTGIFPIIAKWVLVGRWKPQRIRIWSVAYFRFWVVKTLLIANPMARLCVGTPLYVLYLRALGAKIGSGAVIDTKHVPVCTDLLSVGAGSVIRKDALLNGYHARAGVIETGAVTIGANVFVGEQSVLDIDTRLEDGAQLGHSSALHAGQVVPAGQCWHGSPARLAGSEYDYRTVAPAACGTRRRAAYSSDLLVALLAAVGPLEAATATLGLAHLPLLDHATYGDVLSLAAVLVFGPLLAGLVIVVTLPRLLTRSIEPGKVYPLYGRHYAIARTIARVSNVPFFTNLFGDSSAIVHYLRVIGYRFGTIVQTGSNFGCDIRQGVPALCEIGSGTMVSDGLTLINVELSASSFRVLPVVVGARNFFGNNIRFPAGARTGDNCLLATKVMVPTGEPVRHDVGLLGSPCFEIPRSVGRDKRFEHLSSGDELQRRLAAKVRYNLATMGLYLLTSYVFVAGLVFIALMPLGGRWWQGWTGIAATALLDVSFGIAFFVLVDRVVTRCRALKPRFCSIYDIEFWRHERFWKLASMRFQMLDGTPFKNLVWRLVGVRIGRRVFDDGCAMPERSLVSLGSDVTLNMGSEVQCHSLEDGVFKSDHISIGNDCTVGTGGWVCYGASMGEGSVLDADSFLMKGSRVEPGARWRGNPATEVSSPPAPHLARVSTGSNRKSEADLIGALVARRP